MHYIYLYLFFVGSGCGFLKLMASNVVVPASLLGGIGVGRGAGWRKVRLAYWNIGSLTGKSIELVKSLYRRRISIACVQETK